MTSIDSTLAEIASQYGKHGEIAVATIEHWLNAAVPMAEVSSIQTFVESAPLSLIFDSFWRTLPFGTGGRRGPVGFGPNRINETTIALTVQGHANYLRKVYGSTEISVVVANDVRAFHDIARVYQAFWPTDQSPLGRITSRSLAKLSAKIYIANVIRAFMKTPEDDGAVLTTPELSFAIRKLGAAGGVNLSASHNHPDDNGIKLYDERGAQFTPPHDDQLAAEMASPELRLALPNESRTQVGLLTDVPNSVHDAYVQIYVDQHRERCRNLEPNKQYEFVYTPLCGGGLSSMGDVLTGLGYRFSVPPGQTADGTFAAIPFRTPNPEVPQATLPALRFATEHGLTMVLSSDPDADRVGVDVFSGDEWVHLNGNDIAVILTYYLMLDEDGPRLDGIVLSTLVTSRLISAIAQRAGSAQIIDDLLVGFKYHANVLHSLESTGRYGEFCGSIQELVVAAEESHGILTTPEIRDKDATSAAIYLAYLHARLQYDGRTLLHYLLEIRTRFPGFAEISRSIVLLGSEGVAQIDSIMWSLRTTPPSTIAGRPVTQTDDFWDTEKHGEFVSNSDRLSRNVIRYQAENIVAIVRPSGTEPKIKFYASVLPRSGVKPASDSSDRPIHPERVAEDAATDLYRQLLGRFGADLSDEALMLPDIATLDSKLNFDREVLPRFRQVVREEWHVSKIRAWLIQEGQSLTPGANPLPAMKRPLLSALSRWESSGEIPNSNTLRQLINELREL